VNNVPVEMLTENDPAPRMDRERPITGKRLVLLAVAGLLIAAAALAIGILLFGDFGSTEGRILATTALLGVYGLLALPAAILRDQGRKPALAAAVIVLALAAASLTIATVWSDEPSDAVGKALGTINGLLVAAVQPAALTLRRREHDAPVVRMLFAASSALVLVLASMLTVLLWAELDSERYGRIFGALIVLDVLLVALQPILARARPRAIAHRLRVDVAAAAPIDLIVEAPDVAAAAAKAIRTVERDGHRVIGLELTGASAEHVTGARRGTDG
jgi:MFS family permease